MCRVTVIVLLAVIVQDRAQNFKEYGEQDSGVPPQGSFNGHGVPAMPQQPSYGNQDPGVPPQGINVHAMPAMEQPSYVDEESAAPQRAPCTSMKLLDGEKLKMYTKTMGQHAKKGRLDDAFKALDKMEAEGLIPNIITYNALINACEKCKNGEKALEVLKLMKYKGLQPNVITYNTAISALGKGKKPAEAIELFEEMTKKSVEPTRITYNSVISACEKGEMPQHALDIFRGMKRKDVYPDRITYNALISACEKGKLPEQALEIFDEMKNQGLQPDIITYNSLLSACVEGKQPEKALKVFDEMERQGVTPDKSTFTTMISACKKCGQTERADKFIEAKTGKSRKRKFVEGSRVLVNGLTSESGKELNGRYAQVISEEPSGRVIVEFSDGSQKALKPERLQIQEQTSMTQPGVYVQVRGLTSDAGRRLNGQIGQVVSEEPGGRVVVELQNSGDKKSLKPENLAVYTIGGEAVKQKGNRGYGARFDLR
eukprot:gnl/TRDRNA2_/TRDRNA2_168856_c1_seq2.p1 gnl/TRDRNA2_/TRDRNA2_168856_c1~~gnl/TRDRNA2_/TRDRNA2_168856_c1_seq2.p1  ORF type:complete len:485 (+),score=87.46 gnl/TRDRNA2_/TRDRNA2_168856_c1_seq2:121-1575(+)